MLPANDLDPPLKYSSIHAAESRTTQRAATLLDGARSSMRSRLARVLIPSLRSALLVLCPALLLVASATATERPEQVPAQADIEQRLDQQIDLSLPFRTKTGETKTLRELMPQNRPVIIAPVYYECPRLCSLTLNGVRDLLNRLDLQLGTDYRVLAISFDPTERSSLAAAKAKNYYATLNEPAKGEAGWEFLTGEPESVRRVMEALGFNFVADEGEFIHAAAIMVVTPQGKISRYFYGVEYPPADVRLALVDASQGRIGTFAEKLFLYCFRFDHVKGKYSLVIWNITRVICGLSVVALGAFLLKLRAS